MLLSCCFRTPCAQVACSGLVFLASLTHAPCPTRAESGSDDGFRPRSQYPSFEQNSCPKMVQAPDTALLAGLSADAPQPGVVIESAIPGCPVRTRSSVNSPKRQMAV